jgi:hypothetical protein
VAFKPYFVQHEVTMMPAIMELHFHRATRGLELSEARFRRNAVERRSNLGIEFKWTRGVMSCVLLLVRHAQGEYLEGARQSAAESLFHAFKKADMPGVIQWPANIFGCDSTFRFGGLIHVSTSTAGTFVGTVRGSELPRTAVHVVVDGVKQGARGLERAYQDILRQFNPAFASRTAYSVDLETQLGRKYRGRRFIVSESDVMHTAAASLVESIAKAGGEVIIANSGGPSMMEVFSDLCRMLREGRSNTGRLTFLGLNNIAWQQRVERSADSIALGAAKELGAKALVSSTADSSDFDRSYRQHLKRAHIVACGAGASQSSFVAKYARRAGVTRDRKIVGDLAYYPLYANGEPVKTKMLKGFAHFPGLGFLRNMVRNGREVIVVLTDGSWDSDKASGGSLPKVAVARASLRAKLASTYVMSARFAVALLGE